MQRKSMFLFNANDKFHKNPAGAAESETPISFRVSVSRREALTDLYLMFSEDKKPAEKIRMTLDTSYAGTDFYTAEIPPLSPGIYWYTFIAEKNGQETVYGRCSSGTAVKNGKAWQQTVYLKGWNAAPEFAGKIIYQIFPDRFFKKGEPPLPERKKYVKFKNHDELPNYIREANGDLDTSDFFGGTLRGIEEKLPYIASLGAEIIYLNPIFEAHSNHRYDTADYTKIDPVLGNEEDFSSLCKTAGKYGIKIILDGVFSHTGDDSIYFNRYGTYPDVGAYQSQNSPYYKWYTFQEFPDRYSSWWGIKILPEVNETEPDYLEYMTGKGGVLEKWLRLGASGYRLDVADELPDEFLDALYKTVKTVKKDAYVVGEVWEDATNKEDNGRRRKYLQGGEMDGVMNYVLKDALIEFLNSGNAEKLSDAINLLKENYPKPSLSCLMNIIGSHDTKRILSVLGGVKTDDCDYEGQAREKLSPEERETAIKKLMLGWFILTTLPGCPTVFYGDEAGVEGLRDPLNRKYFPWGKEDKTLLSHYRKMGDIRKNSPELKTGEVETVLCENSLFVYSRNGFVAVCNGKNAEDELYLDRDFSDLVSGKKIKAGILPLPPYSFFLLK